MGGAMQVHDGFACADCVVQVEVNEVESHKSSPLHHRGVGQAHEEPEGWAIFQKVLP
jgi:hypothetical protein